jgi:hypothetical protein
VTTSSSIPLTIRFGVFELDPRAGELRKRGMKIRPRGAERNLVVETRATRGSPAPSQSRGFWTLILSLALEFLSGAKHLWCGRRLRYGPVWRSVSRCQGDVDQPGYVGKAYTIDGR